MEYEIDTELEPRSENPSLNSEIHESTEIQSNVRPRDYPREDRDEQKALLIPEEEEVAAAPS